jgi:hypothetical protein
MESKFGVSQNLYCYCLICDKIKIISEEYFKGLEFCEKCKEMTPHRSELIPKEEANVQGEVEAQAHEAEIN